VARPGLSGELNAIGHYQHPLKSGANVNGMRGQGLVSSNPTGLEQRSPDLFQPRIRVVRHLKVHVSQPRLGDVRVLAARAVLAAQVRHELLGSGAGRVPRVAAEAGRVAHSRGNSGHLMTSGVGHVEAGYVALIAP
jgi:hypothetical protein